MSAANKALITAAMAACQGRLEVLGFSRHTWDIYTLPLAPQILGWATFGQATHRGDGSMQITPDVGLLHVDVERFVSSLMQLPYHRYHPATVQTPVGLLMPEGVDVRVVFYPHQAVDEPAERAIRPIGEYGIPWMRDHASLAGIYALINSGRFNNSALHACRRPVIAWMLGDPELARQHVRERLEEIETEGGRNAAGAREVYQRFAAALEERMASG